MLIKITSEEHQTSQLSSELEHEIIILSNGKRVSLSSLLHGFNNRRTGGRYARVVTYRWFSWLIWMLLIGRTQTRTGCVTSSTLKTVCLSVISSGSDSSPRHRFHSSDFWQQSTELAHCSISGSLEWAESEQRVSREWAESEQRVSREWAESEQRVSREWAESEQRVSREWADGGFTPQRMRSGQPFINPLQTTSSDL